MTAKLIGLGVGSLLGGLARYFMSGTIHKTFDNDYPYGTLAVNILGCVMIGVLNSISDEKFFLGSNGRILLMTGFCGAFTTFSALMLETDSLIKHGPMHRALGYVILSCVLGFIAFRLGSLLGRSV